MAPRNRLPPQRAPHAGDAAQAHGRVALLPFTKVRRKARMRALPRTIGEHIREVCLARGLMQREEIPMRSLLSVIAALLLVASHVAHAKPPAPVVTPASASASHPAARRLGEAQFVEHRHYLNHDGQVVHSPAHTTTGAVPAGASARCGDGTLSFSQHHRGTCSHHGGVATWL